MKKILVIGSTGLLGKPTTQQLIRSGYDVSLLARNPGKTRELFPNNRIVEGDVFDQDNLREAFQGQEIVYINLSIAPSSRKKDLQPERDGINNIIAAAKQSKVQRLAYLSSLIKDYQGMNGFDWWAFHIKNNAVRALKESGIAYSIFYPSTFMETFHNMIRGNNLYLISGSQAPMWFIAAEDYGKQVAKAFEITKGNQEFIIQGLEPYTFEQGSKVLVENYKKSKLKITRAPIGVIKILGYFSPKINYVANIINSLNHYPEKFGAERTWDQLGKPVITLADFASSL